MLELHELKDHVFQDRTDKAHWNIDSIIETKALKYSPHAQQLEEKDNEPAVPTVVGGDDIDNLDVDLGYMVSESHDVDDEVVGDGTIDTEDSNSHKRRIEVNEAQLPKKVTTTNHREDTAAPSTQLDYIIGHFVIVNVDKDTDHSSDSDKFWVGKVISVVKNQGEQYVRQLRVHWYDVESSRKASINPVVAKFFPCYANNEKRRRLSSLSSRSRGTVSKVPWVDVVDTDTVLITFESLKKNHTLPVNVQNKLVEI